MLMLKFIDDKLSGNVKTPAQDYINGMECCDIDRY